MITPQLSDDDPGCPEPALSQPAEPSAGSPIDPARKGGSIDGAATSRRGGRALVARRQPFASIEPAAWDRLVDLSPAATPFARHCLQEAWWRAYGATAHDHTLVVVDETAPDDIVGIVPLMHRHAIEPGDLAARTALRHECPPVTAVAGSATAVFFGASYHADYATVLAPEASLPAVCDAAVGALSAADAPQWDVVDLRRLRCVDPAADALAAAFERLAPAQDWRVTREREEVCPVLTLEPDRDFEAYLATLGKKERHEIRRKLRRAEGVGPIALTTSRDPLAELEAFVDLHQRRWGEEGLFPDTAGGAASRRFFAGLFDGCARGGLVEMSFLTIGDRRVAAGVTLDDGETIYYYNAGVDPDARDLSPGVLMVAAYVRRAIELGRRRVDFMRGDEPYKYGWGAVDEPIQRLLVERLRPPVATDEPGRGSGR